MDLIDFLCRSNTSATTEELTGQFLKFLTPFGIDRLIMGHISQDGTTARKEQRLGLLVHYPREWMAHYYEQHYIDYDPVYRAALTARRAFTWQEARARHKGTRKTARLMNEARECGLHGGIGLSIHRPLGAIIGMGFAGSAPGVRCDGDAVSLVSAAAHQFFAVYAELAGIDEQQKAPVELTAREREVLYWLADGKTRVEISDIISCSESCISRYCETLFGKLQANNAQASVAKALRLGLVNPF